MIYDYVQPKQKNETKIRRGVPSSENSHTRWGQGKGIPRWPYPYIIIKRLVRTRDFQATSRYSLPLKLLLAVQTSEYEKNSAQGQMVLGQPSTAQLGPLSSPWLWHIAYASSFHRGEVDLGRTAGLIVHTSSCYRRNMCFSNQRGFDQSLSKT